MDVFNLRNRLVRDYASYVQSFIHLRDPIISKKVFEISREEFEQFMFEPAAERNKHMWFMKVKDIKSFRPILKLVAPHDTEGV